MLERCLQVLDDFSMEHGLQWVQNESGTFRLHRRAPCIGSVSYGHTSSRTPARAAQGRIGHRLDLPQRMVPGHPFLQGDNGQRAALGMRTAAYRGSLRQNPNQPRFSAACWRLSGCLGSTSPRNAGPCRTLRANARRRGAGCGPSEGFGGSVAPCAATRIPS